ncbi:tumor necrosis factor receptor superfamily member 18 [Pelodytes ibericus]
MALKRLRLCSRHEVSHPRTNAYNPCPNALSLPEDCRCNPGYACDEIRCLLCLKLPNCPVGQELIRKGDTLYSYTCENCTNGTYKKDKRFCIHKQKPSKIPPSVEVQSTTSNNSVITEPITHEKTYMAVAFVSVVFLILMSIAIHFLIWKLRKTKQAELHPAYPTIRNHKEDGDSWSYQYPEEEHGEITMEKQSVC